MSARSKSNDEQLTVAAETLWGIAATARILADVIEANTMRTTPTDLIAAAELLAHAADAAGERIEEIAIEIQKEKDEASAVRQ